MAKKAAPKAAEPKAAAATGEKASTKPATKTEFYATARREDGPDQEAGGLGLRSLPRTARQGAGQEGSRNALTVPGLYKIKVVHKPATKARPGFNPATKQPIMIKAKPARKVIKVLPLKALKDMI